MQTEMKKPRSGQASGLLESNVNLSRKNVMSNISTAASNVIPFLFDAQEVRAFSDDAGEPWFCAADVCAALGYANTSKAISDNCREAGVTTGYIRSGGQGRTVKFINEGNLYRLIIKSRKEEAQRFESWVCDEVLPAIRKTGRYEDTNNKMATLVGDVIGSTGEVVLNRVIEQKGYRIAPAMQRSYKHTMKSRLRSRFNVQKASLIPADQMEAACNFIAAYAIEGEFLPKQEAGAFQLTDNQAMDLSRLLHSVAWVGHRWGQGISAGLSALNPELYGSTVEHVQGMARAARSLDSQLQGMLSAVEQRYSLGGRRPSESMAISMAVALQRN